MSPLIQYLADPPAQYRPVPFWSWNADLTAEELVRQVDLMKSAGMGGFFMHARGGLQTPYMGDDWFRVTEAVLDAAAGNGMYAWAYDENGWPSGFGDGKVNGLGEACQLKYFRCRKMDAAQLPEVEKLLAVYTVDGVRISDPATAEGEVLAVWYEVNPFYVDNADPEVVKIFLNVIYQTYYDRIPEEKRRHLAGFFTDEPQLSRNGIPYSPAMLAEYKKTWGEDAMDRIPELFLKIGEYTRTRVRFWQTMARCFAHSYSKQLGEWCEAHGMKLTGHMVCEETYESQTVSNGAVMPHYPHFHIPGIDSLGLALHPFTLQVQTWSACAQAGRNQMLTETYAGCGWNVSFDDLRYMLNDQMVRGANLLCPHLESYTLRGIRKRDYPASLFFHQPWWPWYRKFTDYASRVGMILASGKDPANVLMIHGLPSGHITYLADVPQSQRYTPEDLCNRYWEKFNELGIAMDARQCPFHLGDAILMEEMASHVTAGGLVIGEMCYQAVIIPETVELPPVQVKLLNDFVDAGFPVFAVKDSLIGKTYSNGEPSDWDGLIRKIRFFDTAEEAAEAVAKAAPRFSIRTPDGDWCRSIVHGSRLVPDWDGEPAEVHFFTNSDREHAVEAILRLPGNSCTEVDAYNGKVVPCAFTAADGFVELHRTIPAGGELLLAVSCRSTDAPVIPAEPARRTVKLPEVMPIRSVTENIFTLDRCDCLVDGKPFLEDEYVLTVHDQLLALKKDVPITQIFRFRAAEDFRPGKLELLLEQAADHKITVNGKPIPVKINGYFRDPAFQRVDIAGAVQPGENEIRLERVFTQSERVRHNVEISWIFEAERNKLAFDTEIEAVYLCGDFAVNTPGTFTPMPDAVSREAVKAGGWELSCIPDLTNRVRYSGEFILANPVRTVKLDAVEQSGFPFFAGIMELESRFTANADHEELLLSFAERRVTVCCVEVNGKEAGELCWYNNTLVIPPELVKKGENTIVLKLVTSLRNMLGPHHLDCGEVNCGSPAVFFQAKGVFCQREPFSWNRDWCFARMGMSN